ncbi:MAG: hypothetical protein RLZZ65_1912 [Bacteroidota bacterium]|jgi:phosphoribosylglycinamide formyltransferase-1
MKQEIIIFISGAGSNARQIIHHFNENEGINICGVVSSKENFEMAAFCKAQGVDYFFVNGQDLSSYLKLSLELNADYIVLAGFLKKIPKDLINAFPDRIINIHPALLPNFGGAGMYGKHVHLAVAAAKASFSGITIHLVNEEFDKGKLLFQHAVALPHGSSPEEIESLVRGLELQHYAADLETFIRTSN